jgi:hypothetical protein
MNINDLNAFDMRKHVISAARLKSIDGGEVVRRRRGSRHSITRRHRAAAMLRPSLDLLGEDDDRLP